MQFYKIIKIVGLILTNSKNVKSLRPYFSLYGPTVNYFQLKFSLNNIMVFGLLIGDRGNLRLFFLGI